jgi:3-phenylpropionate/trans-cinnamate dioxygenase ferredoxin reductase subunit
MDKIVIVGAGLGGVTAAKALRARGFEGSLVVIGDETHDVYDRPPLSKHVLLGLADHVRLPVNWADLAVHLRSGETACGLSPAGSGWNVWLESGDEVPADRVIVATGARPIAVPGLSAHPNVFTLRSLDDAHALRAELRRNIGVVVIGAGWIGAEVASSAAEIGCSVRVVEPEAAPASRSLGLAVGGQLVPWYAESGVELLLSRRVVGATDREVELDDGSRLPADVIVVGVGVAPSTEWLSKSAVELDARGGIVVDEFLQCVSAGGVYALGDCASYPSRRYSTRLRPEHWTNAQVAGSTVAASVLGAQTAHDPVPYVWSQQFGRMVQYAGHHEAEDKSYGGGIPLLSGGRRAGCETVSPRRYSR